MKKMSNFEIKDDDFSYVDSVGIYCSEIYDSDLLSIDEEKELFLRVKNGDCDAKRIIIEKNLGLVVSVAKRFIKSTTSLQFLDLIQEGNFGLFEAVDRFDLNRGCRFSTYAVSWIIKFIRIAISEQDSVFGLSKYERKMVNIYMRTVEVLKSEFGREPMIDEVAARMGITVEAARKWYFLKFSPISYNAVIGEDDREFGDRLYDEDDFDKMLELKSLTNDVRDILNDCDLTSNELEIICLVCGFNGMAPVNLEEAGVKCGMTRQGAKYIFNRVLWKLRCCDNIQKLVEYFDNTDEVMERLEEYRAQYKNGGKTARCRSYLDNDFYRSTFGLALTKEKHNS